MLPITRAISKYNHYNSNKVKYIICHYTGNASDTAKNNANYFCGGNRNASAHYFVDNNSIYQVVEDYHGAWHIGNTKTEANNLNSIGIEMCCSGGYQISEKTEQNTIELVKYLMNKYNVPIQNVRTHAEVTKYGKICPNWSDNNWSRWNNFKNKLTGNISNSQPVEEPVEKPINSTFKVGEYAGYVETTDSLNIRKTRNPSSAIVGSIPKGTKVRVTYIMYQDNSTSVKGSLWGSVYSNHGNGFINMEYVKSCDNNVPSNDVSYVVKILVDSLNIRKEASFDSAIVGTLKKGDAYTIVEEKNGLGLIKSRKGWISLGNSYVKKI